MSIDMTGLCSDCPHRLFTAHIAEHLGEGELVLCKICGASLEDFR